MIISNRSLFQAHPFHLVSASPWPALSSVSLFNLTFAGTLAIQIFTSIVSFIYISTICLLNVMFYWFKDITTEATYLGNHTMAVQRGLFIGIALFIVSETLFFIAIFWAYFHSSLSPTVELGMQWPPVGVQAIDPFELPLLNTSVLLSSGFTVTQSHHSIISGDRSDFLKVLLLTIQLALFFTVLQSVEYLASSFTISDGIFGSCFFFGTGFHGFHVLVGSIFLVFCLGRGLSYHLTQTHHLGLESSIMYWHFVDIVWIFLYISVYYWGS